MSTVKLNVLGVYPGKSPKAPTSLKVVNPVKGEPFYLKVWRFNAERGLDKGTVINIAVEKIKSEEYQGKTQYSCNDSDISFDRDEHHQPTQPTTAVKAPVSNKVTESNSEVWERKDRLKTRTMCTAYGKDIVVAFIAKGIIKDPMLISKFIEGYAHEMENDIYRSNGQPTASQKELEGDFAPEPDQADLEQGLPLDSPTGDLENIPF